MQKPEIVIVGMVRTPIGKYMGGLSSLSAVELGIIAGREAIKRANVSPADIDEVIAGMVYKAALKGNPARQIQLALEIPIEKGAATIEQQCASSMRALEMAMQQIQLNKTETALVCGIESMTNVPYYDTKGRSGYRLGPSTMEDGLQKDGLYDAFDGLSMAITAERLAEQYNITREEVDQLALMSQERALSAMAAGKFKGEIVPVEVTTRKGTVVIDTDEHPRQTSMEELAKMKPMFKADGIVTAGNSSGMNDGACAMVIMNAEKAKKLGLKPLGRILSTVTVGVKPEIMGIGPVYAIPEAVKQAGLKMEDIQYQEINEAFAAQFVACQKAMDLDMGNVNANGSGIALGHPVGCTGLRLVLATMNELKRRGQTYGCASLCAGGGVAMAVVVENL